MQLELFRGPHIPLTRCLAALEAGDVHGAREALDTGEFDGRADTDRARLAFIAARVPPIGAEYSISPQQVHAAFEAALQGRDPVSGPGEIPAETWFRGYARHVAAALEAGSGPCFRGWCALHFELAAGRPEAALRSGQRLLSACDQGWAVLEAARAAWAAGEPERAARLVLVACLKDQGGLDPAPPRIAAAPLPGLNPPPGAVPRFPPVMEDLWTEVEVLELPGPASPWVPAVGIIDGVFAPSLLGWSVDLEGSGFDPSDPATAGEPAAREFLRALLAARHARVGTPVAARAGFGEAELAARRRMKPLAPTLLARYLARLGGPRPARDVPGYRGAGRRAR